jgi:hypothetical protein
MADLTGPYLYGVYELPAPIGVSKGCLGKSFPITVASRHGKATLPIVDWNSGRWGKGNPVLAAPATGLGTTPDGQLLRFATNREKNQPGMGDLWGKVSAWRTEPQKVSTAFVRAMWLQFRIRADDPLRDPQSADTNSPRELAYKEVYGDIDRWFEAFRTWLELMSDQDLDPEHPLPNGHSPGSGLSLFAFDQGKLDYFLGVRAISSIARMVTPLSVARLRLGFRQANANAVPSDARLLLRDAYAENRRDRTRRAVIDAGSAVELTLADYAAREAVSMPAKPTLGAYVKDLQARASLPANTKVALVDVRNAAIHENQIPTHAESHTALGIASTVLDKLDPLPT